MRCSRYGNGSRMYVRLNGEPLKEVNSLSTWDSKCQRMEVMKGCGIYTESMKGIERGER